LDKLGKVKLGGIEIGIRDLLPFVGSMEDGKLTGTPAALQAAGRGESLITGTGFATQLKPDAKLMALDVATAGVAQPMLQAGKATAKRVGAMMKDLPVGASIKPVDNIFEKAPKTESKAFKNWFGDSKAVDEGGKPVVLYHGTGSDITEFKTEGGKGKTSGTGLFLTSDPDLASTYVPTHPAMSSSVYPVYASMKKPFVVDFNGSNWNRGGSDALVKLPDGSDDDLLSYFNAGRDETVSTDDVARLAREMGYDGVIIKNVFDNGPYNVKANDNPSDLYVVFNPTQVKSATGNRGTFDPKDPSIVKGVGIGGTGAAATQEESK